MEYDPIEAFIAIMTREHDWDTEGVRIRRSWEMKADDLRAGDLIVVGPVDEDDEFLGIGGMEYARNVTLTVHIYTVMGRERIRMLAKLVRDIIRRKENWEYDGRILLNMRISALQDMSDREKGIYSVMITVEWFTIEVRV